MPRACEFEIVLPKEEDRAGLGPVSAARIHLSAFWFPE